VTALAATVGEPISSVLVPTDFSGGAEHALRRARLLPLGEAATIRVVHVLPSDLPGKMRADVEERANQALDDLVARSRAEGIGSGTEWIAEVLWGAPFVEIIRHARSVRAQLIVLGRHGQRPIRDRFIGSTAERVVLTGDVPVLVVNNPPEDVYWSPLVATDLGDASWATFDMALRLLGTAVDRVHVVHVFHVPFEGLIAPPLSINRESGHRSFYRERAVAALETFLEARRDPGIHWDTAVVPGDARSVILREVRRRRADLLVVGTHSRSGVAHALIGSVAERVISTAICDVLVVRPPRFSFRLP